MCISEEHLKYKLELGRNVTISGNDWYTKETNNTEGCSMNNVATNVVGQGIGSGVAYINQLRADQLLANLSKQDVNLENAIAELNQLRNVIEGTLQGSKKTVHGIIAEHTQVRFSNARNYVAGKEATYFKEPDSASLVDYWNGDTPIQSKFLDGVNKDGVQTIKGSLTNTKYGIFAHLEKYPNYLKSGGIYQVPKDQYEHAISLLSKPTAELSLADKNTVQAIREFEKVNNVKFEEVVRPSVVKYGEVQKNVIGDTIDNEQENILEIDKERRLQYENQSRATMKQGAQVAAISAAIEGATNFGITVVSKFKQGKKISDFTENDWNEIFINTASGSLKGGIRGASVYALTNLTEMNAVVATSLVTVAFGAISLTTKFAKDEITSKEYADSLQQLGVETSFSAATAAIGQALIPVPVVGALVGSLVGNVILGNIQRIAAGHLQGSQFLIDIEKAYTGTAGEIYESTQTFTKSLNILEQQHKDFSSKQIRDRQLTNELYSLYESI